MEDSSNRDTTLDILRGIAIFSILLGHAEWDSPVHNFISVFDLLLFFFVGSVLVDKSVSKYVLHEFIAKKFVRILIPFLFSVTLFSLYALIDPKVGIILTPKSFFDVVLISTSDSFKISGIQLYFWFLPFYFLFSLVFFIINKYFKKELIVIAGILFALSIRLFILSQNGIYSSTSIIWSIDKLPVVLLFGIIFKYIWEKRRLIYDQNILVFSLTFLILISSNLDGFDLRKMYFGAFGVIGYLFFGVIGLLMALAFSSIIQNLNHKKNLLIFFFEKIGKISLFIYILHGFTFPFFHERMIGCISNETHLFYNFVVIGTTILIAVFYSFVEDKAKHFIFKSIQQIERVD